MTDLKDQSCKACEGGVSPLSKEQAAEKLQQLPGWQLDGQGKKIYREFEFRNYYRTIAFVNAIAWMTHQENHHPDLEVGYNQCIVYYTTHAISGLSDNDFICAAKVNHIHQLGPG